MILEGVVTSVSPAGEVNIAPMGPHVDGPEFQRFLLRPFPTSRTYQNLKASSEGVLHVTDDVWLLARGALGPVEPLPVLTPADHIRGWVLADACRFWEFRVTAIDEREERMRIECEVVYTGRLRDFFGFNRAKHAVLEAAILATRMGFLPLDEIQAEYRKLGVIVGKTGGAAERQAFEFLQAHVEEAAREAKA